MAANYLRQVRRWSAAPETAVIGGLAVALALVLWPAPGELLDVLLAASLAAALWMLVVSLLGERADVAPLLPQVMVLTSLLRITVCVGVARRIIYDASPGALVSTLGQSATGSGQQFIGGVALVVLLGVVGYMVLMNGVMRLAEVAARFALDAMPGRQLAIDSALSHGRLDQAVGDQALQELDGQSAFCGAMDGVGRFLRGEIIGVAVIVLATPLAAALAQGSGGDALGTYLPLMVGHGLAALVPLLVAGAAAATALVQADRGPATAWRMIAANATALWGVAGVMAVIAVLPGMPAWPLALLSAFAGLLAYVARRRSVAGAVASDDSGAPAEISLRLGLGLMGLVADGGVQASLQAVRARLADDLGVAVPGLRVSDDRDLAANAYQVAVGGEVAATGLLRPGRLLAVPGPDGMLPPGGEEMPLPDGRPASWVGDEASERAERLGCQLLSPTTVLEMTLEAAIRAHADRLFTLQGAAELVEAVRAGHPASVAAMEAAGVTAPMVREVGASLLGEGIPLTGRVSLVEAMAAHWPGVSSVADLVEAIRPSQAGTIGRAVAPDRTVRVAALAADLEAELAEACRMAHGEPVTLPPSRAAAWHRVLQALAGGMVGPWPPLRAVLCRGESRRAVAQLAREAGAELRAIRSEELPPLTRVEVAYEIGAPDLDRGPGSLPFVPVMGADVTAKE